MYNTNQFTPYFGRQPYYVPTYQQPAQPIEMAFSDVRILTADQIKGFIPPINSKVLLIDKDNGIAYVETTDTMGNMYKQPYSFAAIKNETKKEKVEEKQDFSNFATKEDIANIRKELETLRKPTVSTASKENVQPKL